MARLSHRVVRQLSIGDITCTGGMTELKPPLLPSGHLNVRSVQFTLHALWPYPFALELSLLSKLGIECMFLQVCAASRVCMTPTAAAGH